MISETKPPDILANEKRSMSEIPITISGLRSGRFVTLLIALLTILFFIEKTPMAAPAPRIVAITEAITATISVFFRESRMSSFEKSS